MRRLNVFYWLRRFAAWCGRRRRKRGAPPPPPRRPGHGGPYRRFFGSDRRVEDIRPRRPH